MSQVTIQPMANNLSYIVSFKIMQTILFLNTLKQMNNNFQENRSNFFFFFTPVQSEY